MVSFSKKERLCSHNLIQELLKNGNSFFDFPFRCVWTMTEQSDSPMKVAFSVPKRRFKHAHQRNLIKRRLRNAYRLHKLPLTSLLTETNQAVICLLVYNSSEIISYAEIEVKIKNILNRLQQQLFVPLEDKNEKKND